MTDHGAQPAQVPRAAQKDRGHEIWRGASPYFAFPRGFGLIGAHRSRWRPSGASRPRSQSARLQKSRTLSWRALSASWEAVCCLLSAPTTRRDPSDGVTLVAPGLHRVLRFAAFCKVACANFSTFLVLSAF